MFDSRKNKRYERRVNVNNNRFIIMLFVRSQAYCADVARYGIDCLVIVLGTTLNVYYYMAL